VPVQQHLGEAVVGAADVDALALAEFAVERDAGHALQRLGEILVREFRHVLGGDRVDDGDFLAFRLERSLVARANARDDDLLEVIAAGSLLAVAQACMARERGENGGTDQV
jgi:hypothetical protein